jgi:uncharacterized membrane protein YvlD (DUF360 family)
MMPVDQQLAGSRNAILNAFVTNIPNSMMPVEQQLAGFWNAVLNAFVTNIPNPMMPGIPFSMCLLQISRIR